jgi:hypothetical protein
MTTTELPVRTATSWSTCGADGCTEPIRPGQRITKPPGRPWQHANCSTAGGWWSRPRSSEQRKAVQRDRQAMETAAYPARPWNATDPIATPRRPRPHGTASMACRDYGNHP